MPTWQRLAFLIITAAWLLSMFELSPEAYRWLPDLTGNEKVLLAVVALLTAVSFAYSDSEPRANHPHDAAARRRRDRAKLLTHGLAIVTAGYALILTAQGKL